ncbi:MAG: CRISPR-associated endonuclease Cas2 [Phototrophicales bacterium]|nr:MAG: CRISPR-associated endonuclease Cas2 [Phototrophicales bacterium]RMG73635.1 MAG: CRISPR-associated endonuclease Cas2 [Chloroflexota bacterium]
MQQVLLIYDIENDRIRSKIANVCLDYGLDRIQYSAFVGRLSRNHQEELMLKIRHLLDTGMGNVKLIAMSMNQWEQRLEIEHA